MTRHPIFCPEVTVVVSLTSQWFALYSWFHYSAVQFWVELTLVPLKIQVLCHRDTNGFWRGTCFFLGWLTLLLWCIKMKKISRSQSNMFLMCSCRLELCACTAELYMVFLLCSHRPREAAVSSVTAGSTPAVWCVVAGPPPERTLSMSCPPWSACQDWILASTPSSPSLTVSAQFTQAFPTLHLERKTNREWPHTGRKSFKNIFSAIWTIFSSCNGCHVPLNKCCFLSGWVPLPFSDSLMSF